MMAGFGVILGALYLVVGFDGAAETMTLEGFTIKFGVFLHTGDHEGETVGVGFHHDVDGLGLGQACDGLDQGLDNMLHGIEVVVVQENAVTGGGFADRRCGTLFDHSCGHKV